MRSVRSCSSLTEFVEALWDIRKRDEKARGKAEEVERARRNHAFVSGLLKELLTQLLTHVESEAWKP